MGFQKSVLLMASPEDLDSFMQYVKRNRAEKAVLN